MSQENVSIHYAIDVMIFDNIKVRTPESGTFPLSEPCHPYLSVCMECSSRVVVAAYFSFEKPSRAIMISLLKEAFGFSEEKPYGGIPDKIFVDDSIGRMTSPIQEVLKQWNIAWYRIGSQYQGVIEHFFQRLSRALAEQLSQEFRYPGDGGTVCLDKNGPILRVNSAVWKSRYV